MVIIYLGLPSQTDSSVGQIFQLKAKLCMDDFPSRLAQTRVYQGTFVAKRLPFRVKNSELRRFISLVSVALSVLAYFDTSHSR